MSEYLSTNGLCDYLSISKATMWRYLKSGKLPQPKRLSRKILLFNKKQVDEMLGLNEPCA
ncbi:helix-turn-helix domain-containing protein [uncultured Campylobacter sp.]|uniref:helix-turn-helix transcriptional regulator n=1 Tax=uncultured Campylobacter sp. TaxID=218934 RepID=UPI0025FB7D9C|nr:helix-turn-helix domain-containing protein [uncultured Campylobacter sp.]